jgi:hypothetical protein
MPPPGPPIPSGGSTGASPSGLSGGWPPVKVASGMPLSALALTATAEKAVMIIITDKKRQNAFLKFIIRCSFA